MGLLETLHPNDLLGFFIELTKTETEEKQWEVWLHKPVSVGFDEFKEKSKKPSKMRMTKDEEMEALARADKVIRNISKKEVGG